MRKKSDTGKGGMQGSGSWDIWLPAADTNEQETLPYHLPKTNESQSPSNVAFHLTLINVSPFQAIVHMQIACGFYRKTETTNEQLFYFE